MKLSRILLLLALPTALVVPSAVLGDDYDDFLKKAASDYDAFRDESQAGYEDFRAKANKEMADFMARPWEFHNSKPPVPAPPDPSPAPVIIPDDDPYDINDNPVTIVIDTVVTVPDVVPQPKPVVPIIRDDIKLPPVDFAFYGTPVKVSAADLSAWKPAGSSERDLARAFRELTSLPTNNMIDDCLKMRSRLSLPDWAYIVAVQGLAARLKPSDPNAQSLLVGFILSQSGYKMRYALDNSGLLHVLFAVDGWIYDRAYYYLDGARYYQLTKPASDGCHICDFSYPGEQAVSLGMSTLPRLDYKAARPRKVTAHYHPELTATVTPNQNLIDFFGDYPEGTLDDTPESKWVIYANTPASPEVRDNLYPALRAAVKGKSELEAVNILLHFCQSFPYGYDSEIWGRDRTFFVDESWHYPKSDCEDHAVQFARVVRDILGLKVALVYYPGHLAAAVRFTDPTVTGDYISHRSGRYIICDPTIFYGNVGRTMRGMNNGSAKLILLDR